MLTCAFSTDPQPLIAGARTQLTLILTNSSEESVSVPFLWVSFPQGDKANDLTTDDRIATEVPNEWRYEDSVVVDGQLVCRFTSIARGEPPVEVAAGASVTLKFRGINVNNQVGTTTLTVQDDEEDDHRKIFQITKFPQGWGNIELEAHPISIYATQPPQPVIITWKGPATASYELEYVLNNELKKIPLQISREGTGTYPDTGGPLLRLDKTTTFTLNTTLVVGDQLHSDQKQTTVEVIPRPARITSFGIEALPFEVLLAAPPRFRLSWVLDNAASFEIVEKVDGRQQLKLPIDSQASTFEVAPSAPNTTYELRVFSKVAVEQAQLPAAPLVQEAPTASATVTAQLVAPPIGTIMPYVGNALYDLEAAGWLACEGTAVSLHHHAALFKVIGYTYGKPGQEGFYLPDLRGLFLRGLDPSGQVDKDVAQRQAAKPGGNTGAQVGTYQADMVRQHSHNLNSTMTDPTGTASNADGGSFPMEYQAGGETAMKRYGDTRPHNSYVHYLIYAGLPQR